MDDGVTTGRSTGYRSLSMGTGALGAGTLGAGTPGVLPFDTRLPGIFMFKAVVASWIAGLLAFNLVILRPILAYGWISPRGLILPLIGITFTGYLLGLSMFVRSHYLRTRWKQPRMMLLVIHHQIIFGTLIMLIDPRALLFVSL